jgi:tetratricopeptide (TPR) repeat protein
MPEQSYWGANGEYGPFSKQEDGWPHAGEVIRYYRRQLGMSAEKLATLYGERIGTPVTARWILKMEQQGKVPMDITKRRIFVKLLKIPPFLLGLAALEQFPQTPKEIALPKQSLSASFDVERQNEDAHLLWKLHYAQSAHDAFNLVLANIHSLVSQQQMAKGSFARHLCELLNSHYRLAATIQRDRGNFAEAYTFANESVRWAKEMGSDPYVLQLLAASQYTRGVVNFAWGVFGSQAKQGNVLAQRDKIEAALADFERALKWASSPLKGILYSEMARAKALISTSLSEITISLRLLEKAEQFVDIDSSDDFYTQILLNADIRGLDKRRLLLGRAKTFLALQRPGKTREELAVMDRLTSGSHTRRRAWTHILSAQASFDLGDFATAIDETVNAFSDCKSANSVTHLARVNELYAQICTSPYKNDSRIKRLGRLLSVEFSQKP